MKIIVPLKLAHRNPVIPTSLHFACHTSSDLVFLHIVDTTPIKRSFLTEPESMREYLKERGEEILEEAQKVAGRCGISIKTELLEGIPDEVICRESRDYDLIVMRSRVFSPKEKLGSVVEKALSRIGKPVMLVNREKKKFETCLVPVDGSAESLKSLYEIKKRRDIYRFKKIIIIYVNKTSDEEIEKKEIYEHHVILESAENIVKNVSEDIKAEVIDIHHRNIAETIIEFSRKNKVDIIFMGTKGKSGLSRLILGSVSRDVASYSTIPVILFSKGYIP